MPGFRLEDYETVESRLDRFWRDHPEGRVLTELVHHSVEQFIVRAEVYADREDGRPIASGYAEEQVGSSPVNRTSALENAETSAVGRALAQMNLAPKGKRPSREEMASVSAKGKGGAETAKGGAGSSLPASLSAETSATRAADIAAQTPNGEPRTPEPGENLPSDEVTKPPGSGTYPVDPLACAKNDHKDNRGKQRFKDHRCSLCGMPFASIVEGTVEDLGAA